MLGYNENLSADQKALREKALVARCDQGDEAAFGALFGLHLTTIFQRAYKIVESRYPRAYARGTADQNPKSNWSISCPLSTFS